jgi:hypothetical protein
MKGTKFIRATLAAAGLASLTLGSTAYAQSADALIDKLVAKGVLTAEEAQALRAEADAGFTKAYQAKSGMPNWVTSFKLNGDFRGRFEGFYAGDPSFVDRNRFRYRLRFGATAVMLDNIEVGLRLTSSEAASGGGSGGDPISGNTTFQDNGSKKFVFIDLAYGKWAAIKTPTFSSTAIIGKMENPFVFSDMVFDGDYTPEGIALQFAYNLTPNHAIKLIGAGFALDEIGNNSRDPYLVGAQLRWDARWSSKIQSSAGAALLNIMSEERLGASTANATISVDGSGNFVTNAPVTTWTVPNQNGGNTRGGAPGFNLVNNFTPLVGDASVTYWLEEFPMYRGAFPIKLAGEYMYNFPGPSDANKAYSLGVTFGKAGRKGLWEVGYRWKELESDAWYEELVDSDFGSFYRASSGNRTAGGTVPGYIPGTNIRGHIVKASYSPYDSWALNVTWFRTETINEVPVGSYRHMHRLQVDTVWKF